MPEYLAPGVYVEEISTGPKPIEGVSTSTAGMLGATERGPDSPKLVTSWLDYERKYGGYIPDVSFLAYSVRGFFDNGGKRCFVGRVSSATADRTIGALGNLTAYAIGKGAWGNNILIKVATSENAEPGKDWFDIVVLYYTTLPDLAGFVDPTDPSEFANPNRVEPDVIEVFKDLEAKLGANNSAKVTINAASNLIRVDWSGPVERVPDQVFAALGDTGDDGAALTAADFNGDVDAYLPDTVPDPDLLGRGNGLAALATIDQISLLMVPDEVRNGLDPVTTQVLNQCERLKDRFALVSVVRGKSEAPQVSKTRDTSYGAIYYPWIEIYDPSINDSRLIPPTGHMAGIYARTDIERGVHKAPANEVVRGARNLEFNVSKGMQDILNPKGINAMRDFRPDGRGIRIWGARTMSSDGEWKYVNVRRLFLFVEESIEEGTQWVVFEPNHEPTWARVQRSITNFLIRVWRNGALQGVTQDEAFFVKCDRTTMTQDDIDNGRLICYIGIAPVKPAEFVIFRIGQKTIEATG